MIEKSVGIVPSLVRNWARVYTFGLTSEIREARRAEIESDLWEHAHDSELGRDARSPFCALHALIRLLAECPTTCSGASSRPKAILWKGTATSCPSM